MGKKITDLPDKNTINDDDLFLIRDASSGLDSKITGKRLKELLKSAEPTDPGEPGEPGEPGDPDPVDPDPNDPPGGGDPVDPEEPIDPIDSAYPDFGDNPTAHPSAAGRGPGRINWLYHSFIVRNGGYVRISAIREHGWDGEVAVDWSTENGSITAESGDYVAGSGTFTWADGEGGVKHAYVRVARKANWQGIQHIYINLSNPRGLNGADTPQLVVPFGGIIEIDDGSVDPTAIIVDQNHPSASDNNPGTAEAPLRTIHAGINRLNGKVDGNGDRINPTAPLRCYVKPGIYTDRRNYSDYGSTRSHLASFETAGSRRYRISVENYPGMEKPILDGDNYSVRGIRFRVNQNQNGHYVTLRGLRVRRFDQVGIWNFDTLGHSNDWPNPYVLKEPWIIDCEVYDGRGDPEDNLACIRMECTEAAVMRGNRVHSLVSTRSNNWFNTSGFQSYGAYYWVVEFNEVYNVCKGIYHKRSDHPTAQDAAYRYNWFHDLIWDKPNAGANVLRTSTNNRPNAKAFHLCQFAYNLVQTSALNWDAGTEHGVVSKQRFMHNNTIVHHRNTGYTWRAQWCEDDDIYDNIVVGASEFIRTDGDTGGGHPNNIPRSDFNLLYNVSTVAVTRKYGSGARSYNSLEAWQDAHGYDTHTKFGDPQFINAAQADFRLASTSPGKGGGILGTDIGLFQPWVRGVGPSAQLRVDPDEAGVVTPPDPVEEPRDDDEDGMPEIGFNFRRTLTLVEDTEDYGVTHERQAHDYPQTSESGRFTYGWVKHPGDDLQGRDYPFDPDNVDPRVAGHVFVRNGKQAEFRVDLPVADANWDINLAMGTSNEFGSSNPLVELIDGQGNVIQSYDGLAVSSHETRDAQGTRLSQANWPELQQKITKRIMGSHLIVRLGRTSGAGQEDDWARHHEDYDIPAGTTFYWVDSANGNDSNDGTTEQTAWRTLEYALTQMTGPGLGLNLKGTFVNNQGTSSFLIPALQPAGDGTEQAPIIIRTAPGEERRAKITRTLQGLQGKLIGSYQKDHVWLVDLEIDGGGQGSNVGFAHCSGGRLIRCKVHNFFQPGGDNLSCVSLNGANGTKIYANDFSNAWNGDRGINSSCIKIYGSLNTEISYNEFGDSYLGVHEKTYGQNSSDLPGGVGSLNLDIHHNFFRDSLRTGVFLLVQNNYDIQDVTIHHNLFDRCNGIDGNYHNEPNNADGWYGVDIYNNTFYNYRSLALRPGIYGDDYNVYNNLFINGAGATYDIRSGNNLAAFTKLANNVFLGEPKVYLGNTSNTSATGAWVDVTANNSENTDPAFVDPDAFDFRLTQGSPALTAGEGGTYAGAFESELNTSWAWWTLADTAAIPTTLIQHLNLKQLPLTEEPDPDPVGNQHLYSFAEQQNVGDWQTHRCTVSLNNGRLRLTNVSPNWGVAFHSVPVIIGRQYRVRAYLHSKSHAGTPLIQIGNPSSIFSAYVDNGAMNVDHLVTATADRMYITAKIESGVAGEWIELSDFRIEDTEVDVPQAPNPGQITGSFTESFDNSTLDAGPITSGKWSDASFNRNTSGPYQGAGNYRYVIPAGRTGAPSGGALRRMFDPADEFLLTFYYRQTPGLLANTECHLFYMLTTMDTNGDPWRGPANTYCTMYLEPSHGGIVGHVQDYRHPGGTYRIGQNLGLSGGATVNDGAWHKIEWHIKLNTWSGNSPLANGVFRCRIDGVQAWANNALVINRHDPAGKCSQLLLGPYLNVSGAQGSTLNLDVDELTLQTGVGLGW